MEVKIIYLDTNILSRTYNSTVSKDIERDAEALAKLVEIENITFVTSYKTKQEIIKTPDKTKNNILRFVYGLISKIPQNRIYISRGGAIGASAIGEGPIGGGWDEINPIYKKLTTIFDEDDAEHIFQALIAKCDYFVTFDKRTILNRALKHKSSVGLFL